MSSNEEMNDDWSNDSEPEMVPGLDPGKLDPKLKNMVENIFSQKFTKTTTGWEDWDKGNPFMQSSVPPTTPTTADEEIPEDSFDLQALLKTLLPVMFKNMPQTQTSGDCYTEMVNSFESVRFTADVNRDCRLRAYCFLEKLYSSQCYWMNRAKEAHGQNSYVCAKVDALKPYFEEEFKNALCILRPEETVDEVD